MTYRVIDIPGGGTQFDDAPRVQIICGSGEPLTLVITYYAGETLGGKPPPVGEITFTDVVEYRWIVDYAEYFPHGDTENLELGLIEIEDSKHIEDMASKGPWRDHPGHRFGYVIKESSVRHFRLAFDEYGMFDIIAFGVSVRAISAV